MRYYELVEEGGRRLVAADDGTAYDLTAANGDLETFGDLARAATISDRTPDEIASTHLDAADRRSADEVAVDSEPPRDVGEVWAAGVTYKISEEARREESGMPDMYLDVYEADRPEIFFKATQSRTVGPGEAVGIREDSDWDVPEPELGIVLHRDSIVGYTIGNDVSSRSIEGENPLYLPQAKVYDRCCSLGPCIATEIADPHDLAMSMTITRDAEVLYDEETSTGEMVRTVEELTSYFTRHNAVPEFSVLLTGTSLVPEQPFTLQEGDDVRIEIDEIGTLRNTVVAV